MRATPLVALALVAVLAGCSGEPTTSDAADVAASPSPAATPAAPSPDPSPEPVVVDPTVVPPVEQMSVEYVEAVVNTIEARSGELFARVLAEPVNPLGALPDGVFEGLEALFAGDRLAIKIEEAEALAESEAARELVLPAEQYTGVRYEILQVSYAEPGCLIAVGRIDRDGSSVVASGLDPVLSILSLEPVQAAENPTPWRIVEDLLNENADGEPNTDDFALDATFAELEPVLQHACVGGEASRVP